jgi:hypothetical protein
LATPTVSPKPISSAPTSRQKWPRPIASAGGTSPLTGQPKAVRAQPNTTWPVSSASRVICSSNRLFSSRVICTLARLCASLEEITIAISSTPNPSCLLFTARSTDLSVVQMAR